MHRKFFRQPRQDNEDRPKEIVETRRNFYGLKLVEMWWFRGNLPNKLEIPFQFFMQEIEDVTDGLPCFKEIMTLSEETLEYLSSRMRKPYWLNRRSLRRTATLGDFAILLNKNDLGFNGEENDDDEYEK